MNKLSKAKRDQLIMIAMGTAIIIAGLYFYVISAQKESLAQIHDRTADMIETNRLVDVVLKKADEIEAQLETAKQELEKREATLAPERDSIGWIHQTINAFNSRHRVSLPIVSQPEIGEVKMFPKFYYKAATFHLSGTAFYHDFGRFVADFENEFPYFRLQNIEMAPAVGLKLSNLTSDTAGDAEKLNIIFDIITPIRPAATTP